MSEMTTEQTIKIVIGVLIFVIVVFGIYVSFRNYVIPYFSGFSEKDSRDFTTPYYKDLVNDNNRIASLDDAGAIIFKGGDKTTYYFSKDRSNIYSGNNAWYNRLVWNTDIRIGVMDKNFKVLIYNQYLTQDSRLGEINGAELVNNDLYKVKIGA